MKRYWILTAVVIVTAAAGIAAGRQRRSEPIVPKKKIVLFNGKDLTGWKPVLRYPSVDPKKTWFVRNGLIYCAGQDNAYGFLRTEVDYANYLLHAEYRWVGKKGGNSGILVHLNGPDHVWPKSFECQMYAGHAGDFLVIGEGKKYEKNIMTKEWAEKGKRVEGRNIKMLNESSEKPVGQWNSYEVICVDDWIVITVNGVLQNVATGTSMTSGKICLQSEGAPVEFRNVYLEPIE